MLRTISVSDVKRVEELVGFRDDFIKRVKRYLSAGEAL
jgi:hypothetical protein